jgi:arylsulfatase A-like enzyme
VSKRLLEQRWPWIVAAGAIVVAFVFSTFVEIQPPGDWDRRPRGSAEDIVGLRDRDDLNVLLIVVDTLRAERLGSYGYAHDTSPVLDRLAHSGVRFERHLAQSSWTKTSMASLWTGLYPQRTGITRYDDVMPEAARMPAEILREAGFETVGLFRNGWVAPTFGFDQGFEVYLRPRPAHLPPNVRRENPTITDRTTDAGVIEAAGEFLRVSGGKRWFLYLHLMDLHEYIYDEESALFGSTNSGIYDNSIRWTDGTIEILLRILSDLGLREKTLIAIASDHGEAFLERGFEGHAREVYRESTEVPFVVSFPFRLDPGVVVKARTQNIDIWPTLLDMLGLAFPEEIDGRSRLPEILANLSGAEDVEGMGAVDGTGAVDEVETAIAHLNLNWAKRDTEPLFTIAVLQKLTVTVAPKVRGSPTK